MKVTINIDATPQELRRFLGLPDLGPLQDEALEMIRERMLKGVEGYDALTLMRGMSPAGYPAWEALQKAFWEGLKGSGGSSESSSDKS